MTCATTGSSAATDAERGSPSIADSSPRSAPGPRTASTISSPLLGQPEHLDPAGRHDDDGGGLLALQEQRRARGPAPRAGSGGQLVAVGRAQPSHELARRECAACGHAPIPPKGLGKPSEECAFLYTPTPPLYDDGTHAGRRTLVQEEGGQTMNDRLHDRQRNRPRPGRVPRLRGARRGGRALRAGQHGRSHRARHRALLGAAPLHGARRAPADPARSRAEDRAMGATLSCRDRAILRAVAGGGAELLGGAEPDLFLDGRCCADQSAAHRLARAGLIATAVPGAPGSRVPARLTTVGVDALALAG